MKEFKERIALVISELKRKGITQKEVATTIGITTNAISGMKKGKFTPKDYFFEKIEQAYGYSARWLKYGEEPKMVETIDLKYEQDILIHKYLRADEKIRETVRKLLDMEGDINTKKKDESSENYTIDPDFEQQVRRIIAKINKEKE